MTTITKKTKRQAYKPSGWQLDPEKVTTKIVQYWVDLTMMSAMIPLETAREMVKNGQAFVTTSQSISAMKDGYAVER